MSSRTDEAASGGAGVPPAYQWWTRAAPWLSRLAALLGLGFMAAFAWQAGLFALLLPSTPGKPPDIANPAISTSLKPRLTGFDKDNNPYWITADQGTQDKKNADIVHLDRLTAQFSNKAGALYDVAADVGDYNRRLDSMRLRGHVRFVQGKRFTARMPEAMVVIKDKAISADRSVVVTLGSGTIRSEGLQITNDGNNILFFNGVHAVFDAAPATGGQNP